MTFFKATDSEMMSSILSLADSRHPMASRQSLLAILVKQTTKRKTL